MRKNISSRLGSDPKLEDMMWASLTDLHTKTPMGVTAENLAVKYELTREEVDAFAIRSQQTWGVANEKGVFADEIVPVEIKTRKGKLVIEVRNSKSKKISARKLFIFQPTLVHFSPPKCLRPYNTNATKYHFSLNIVWGH